MKHVRAKIIQRSGNSVWNIIAETTGKCVDIALGLAMHGEQFVIFAEQGAINLAPTERG